MTEPQLLTDELRDKTIDLWVPALNDILDRALKDRSFVHIRLIDEYGTTIFNQVQLNEVVPELQRLLAFTTSGVEARIVQRAGSWRSRREMMSTPFSSSSATKKPGPPPSERDLG